MWSGVLFMQDEVLVKAQQELGETMRELGLAFIKISKFETEDGTLNSQRVPVIDGKRVTTAAVKESQFYREVNAQSVKHLLFSFIILLCHCFKI